MHHVVLWPVEVGGIDFEEHVVDEAGHVDAGIGMFFILGLAQVGSVDPSEELPPVGSITVLCDTPILDEINHVDICVVMAFKIALIRRFFHGVNTPVLAIDEDHGLPYRHGIDVERGSHGL